MAEWIVAIGASLGGICAWLLGNERRQAKTEQRVADLESRIIRLEQGHDRPYYR